MTTDLVRRLATTCIVAAFLGCLAQAEHHEPETPLISDTPAATAKGNTFVAPEGWILSARGSATVLEAPEGGSWVALVDVEAESADDAIDKAWSVYGEHDKPLKLTNDSPDTNGWSELRRYDYQVSPNDRRALVAGARYSNDSWTVWIYDMADDIGGKRGAQVNLIFSSLLPKGYSRETFAGRTANKLDAGRIAALGQFVTDAQEATGVPGVSVGIIQDGDVVFAGGFGVRELGKPEPVDENTLYIVASNTKAMTTLLLARLVDNGKLTWKTPVSELMPSFRLGDADTTASVLVEHLVCACTGLPRKDMELIFEYGGLTAEDGMATLANVQPTSEFGEMFQYSNGLAAAAGYIGGHVMYPERGLGPAYDMAMQEQVFDPLGMKFTTFDYERAIAGDYARAHSADIEGKPAVANFDINYAVVHVRPAGAAWSNITDMLKYVAMELDEGVLPDGRRYVSSDALLERRAPKVPTGENSYYGMGLAVDETYGVPVVNHGGDVFGHHSDMMWLPEHGIGAVVLTNGDPGWLIRSEFQRKLLEVVFDGNPEADASVAAAAERYFAQIAAERELLDVPAAHAHVDALAEGYRNDALGDIDVRKAGDATVFDFGEWKSEVGTRTNPDGSVSFITIDPAVAGFEFVVGGGDAPVLVMRDAQHEYVFEKT